MKSNKNFSRFANNKFRTKETEIEVEINLDGNGKADIETGNGFFNHLLENMAVFSCFDLYLRAKEIKKIDFHHVIEDTGIALGEALRMAISDRKGIERIGFCCIPMDDALIRIALDISGRASFFYNSPIKLSFEIWEFLRALTSHAFITLHVDILKGENEHHIHEAIFKGLGLCLRKALTRNKLIKGVLSSK